jgi:hypothetical protein
MSWTINFTGTDINLYGVSPGTDPEDFGIIGPHLKVDFYKTLSQTKATGDLLSLNLAPVPEPEIYAMLGVGLGLMGWVGRRRKLQAA